MKRTLLLAAFAATLAGCGAEPPPAPKAAAPDPLAMTAPEGLLAQIRTARPESAEVRDLLRVPGRIEVDQARVTRVGAAVTGRITVLDAAVGSEVRRGDILATLSSTELSSSQLAFLKAYSQRLLAERGAQRAQQLFDAEVISQAELQRRQAELVQAEAEASAARDQLKVLGMSEKAIAALAGTRQINSISHVVSSLNGTVIERGVTQGQVVQPADMMFVVADLSSVWLVADIPEGSAGGIVVGEQVRAQIPSLPGFMVEGRLSFVSATLNPETRTVRVRMDIANPNRDFKPAMLATMLIKGPSRPALLVPADAVVREDNKDHVFVQTGPGAFTLRPVSLGGEFDGRRELRSGVRPDEVIVIDGAFHLNNERKRRALGS
jgi:cobalt-zinc-cadmium efflux system membrane fusion protein